MFALLYCPQASELECTMEQILEKQNRPLNVCVGTRLFVQTPCAVPTHRTPHTTHALFWPGTGFSDRGGTIILLRPTFRPPKSIYRWQADEMNACTRSTHTPSDSLTERCCVAAYHSLRIASLYGDTLLCLICALSSFAGAVFWWVVCWCVDICEEGWEHL